MPSWCKKMLLTGGVLGVIAGFIVLAKETFAPSVSYRYKMTVVVDTPQGQRSGSSVIAVTARDDKMPFLIGGTNFHTSYRGEAVAVEIAPGQTLFALLDEDNARRVKNALVPDRNGLEPIEHVRKAAATKGKIVALPRWLKPFPGISEPRNGYPMLVRFQNVNDPGTVELVDPDNLAASFGPGVALNRITVEITDEPVTWTIDSRLDWLGLSDMALDDHISIPSQTRALRFSQTINHGHFRTGVLDEQ